MESLKAGQACCTECSQEASPEMFHVATVNKKHGLRYHAAPLNRFQSYVGFLSQRPRIANLDGPSWSGAGNGEYQSHSLPAAAPHPQPHTPNIHHGLYISAGHAAEDCLFLDLPDSQVPPNTRNWALAATCCHKTVHSAMNPDNTGQPRYHKRARAHLCKGVGLCLLKPVLQHFEVQVRTRVAQVSKRRGHCR